MRRETIGALALTLMLFLALPSAAGAVTKTFTGSGGDWNAAGNWSPAGVPSSTDDVVVPAGQSPNLNGIGVANSVALNAGGFLTVTGAGADLTVGTGTSTFSGVLQVMSGGVVDLQGTTNWLSGNWNLGSGEGGTINNSGTLNITGDTTASQFGSGLLDNTGTVNRNSSSGTAHLQIAVDNDGALNANAGTLQLSGGNGDGSSGTATIASGATLDHANGTATYLSGSSLTGAGTFRLSGGIVQMNAGSTYNPPVTQMVSGELVLGTNGTTGRVLGSGGTRSGTGTLSVGAGASTLGNTTLIGPGTTTFAAGGTVEIAHGTQIFSGHTVNLHGTTTWASGNWNLGSGSGATVNNTGTFNITGVGAVQHFGNGLIDNTGTINRNGSSGTAAVQSALDNDGTLNVDSGTLQLSGGNGDGSSGTTTIASGTRLDQTGGTAVYLTGSSLTGPGDLRVGGAVVQMDAGSTFDPSVTRLDVGELVLNVNATTGRLLGTGGTRSGSGTLTVGATASTLGQTTLTGPGTTTFPVGSTVEIAHGTQIFRGHTVNLHGTTTWASGNWNLGSGIGATVNNTGTFNITGDGALQHFGNGVLDNTGTINRTTGTGTAAVQSALDNDGTININSGTLNISGGNGDGSSGTTAIASGAVLDHSNATATYLSGSSLAGAGTFRLSGAAVQMNAGSTYDPAVSQITSGDLALNVNGTTGRFLGSGGNRSGTGTLSVGTGASTLGATTLTGPGTTTFAAGGTVDIAHGTQVFNGHTLDLEGTTTWASGSWNLGSGPGATVNNGGTFNITGDGALQHFGAGDFNNNGTLNRTGSAGTASVQLGIDNSGDVNVDTGKLLLSAGYAQAGGTTAVAQGATLEANGVTMSDGTLRGAGTVRAPVTNSGGTVAPGTSPGELTIDGSYTQGSAGTLRTEIDGTTPGTGFDRLEVTGAVSLDGALAIDNGPGFSPAASDTFRILDAASRTGTFATVSGTTVPAGTYTPQYDGTGVTLTIAPNPPANTAAPSLPTSGTVGSTITCNPGTWSGDPAFTFEWLRDGTPISGADDDTYTLAAEDAGKAITCRVTGTNSAGTHQATSGAVTPKAKPGAPKPNPRQDPPRQDPPRQDPPAQDPPVVPRGDCTDRVKPTTVLRKSGLRLRGRKLRLRGSARETGECQSGLRRVQVSLARVAGRSGVNCRFVKSLRRFALTKRQNCRRPVLFTARGTGSWSQSFRFRLPPGRYRVQARAADRAGNKDTPRRRQSIVIFTVL